MSAADKATVHRSEVHTPTGKARTSAEGRERAAWSSGGARMATGRRTGRSGEGASSGDAGQNPVDSKEREVMRVQEIGNVNARSRWRKARDCQERNGSG